MNQPVLFDINVARRVHLSHFLEHESSSSQGPLSASVVLPHAYWSAAEKASFFESLSRHSRWKPDAISEELGGRKTVADVCSYIELLEQGSACESRQGRCRDAQPSAREVSEQWIEVEEWVAETLNGEEEEWQKFALKRKWDDQLKEIKHVLPGGTETVPQESLELCIPAGTDWKRQRKALDQTENETRDGRMKRRKRELALQWKRETLLSSLDGKYLNTMDKMVHTLESAEEEAQMNFKDSTRSGQNTARDGNAQLTIPLPRSVADLSTSAIDDHGSNTEHRSGIPNIDIIHDSQIDPTLLALDVAATSKQSTHLPYSHDIHIPSVALLTHNFSQKTVSELPPSHPPSLRPSTRLSPHPNSPPSPTPFASDSPIPGVSLELPHDLSPASRRRLRKRLWTRRKRAMAKGLSVSEASRDIRKLKRGRKAKAKVHPDSAKGKEKVTPTGGEDEPDLSAPTTPMHDPLKLSSLREGPSVVAGKSGDAPTPDTSGDEASVTDGLEAVSQRNPYGWARLQALEINGATLRADGLDLFHLGRFVGMMSFLRQAYSSPAISNQVTGEENSEETPSALSYTFFRLLRACLIHFITRLIANIIAHKTVETRQKRRIRGIFQTGGAEEIRAENVHEALSLLGKDVSRKQLFKRLKHIIRAAAAATVPESENRPQLHNTARSNCSESSSEELDSSDMEDDASSDNFKPDAAVQVTPIPGHAPPPPVGFQASTLYWDPLRLPVLANKNDTILLPEDIDEAALARELRAEEKLDKKDREEDRLHERDLWGELGVQGDVPLLGVGLNRTRERKATLPGAEPQKQAGGGAGASQSLRFREPGGVVKSRVYINSDEDS